MQGIQHSLGVWFDQSGLPFLLHVYQFAEVYTVALVWIVIPLGFYACYRFFQGHYDMFLPRKNKDVKKHGAH